jgi:hypothetical protein
MTLISLHILFQVFMILQPTIASLNGLLIRDVRPSLPADNATTQYCTWWFDLTEALDCQQLLNDNFITEADFRRWVSLMGLVVLNMAYMTTRVS